MALSLFLNIPEIFISANYTFVDLNQIFKMSYNIIIAGAGGIGQAVGLILAVNEELPCKIFVGDISQSALTATKRFIEKGSVKEGVVETFIMSGGKVDESFKSILEKGDIILDCLPGRFAPAMAKLCVEFKLHYANLTEYVAETNQIIELADGADTGFVLQTGVAPGFVNMLGHSLYQQFQRKYGTDKLDLMEMKVGAISQNASAPHFYAFTWSPIGVATEYVKNAMVVKDYQVISVPSLSDRQELMLNGRRYEDDFTSGGAADFPSAFKDKVKELHYKTLRFVGHYQWVREEIKRIGDKPNIADLLEESMLEKIPSVENDHIIIYCRVVGKDTKGRLRAINKVVDIYPKKVGNQVLRAIQSATASALCESARMLLTGLLKNGVNLQSSIDPDTFINGPFIRMIYGDVLD